MQHYKPDPLCLFSKHLVYHKLEDFYITFDLKYFYKIYRQDFCSRITNEKTELKKGSKFITQI
jgi:hypothetical protein